MAELEKNNFLLPNRLNAVVAKLSDKQAGVLFKGILEYADKSIVAEFDDGMVAVVFEMARQEIDYNAEQYAKTCLKNAKNGKLGGAPKGNHNAKKQPKQPTGCLINPNNPPVEKTTQINPKQPKSTQNNPNDMSCYDVDVDMSCYDMKRKDNKLLTAQVSAGSVQSNPKPKTAIQQFANRLLENFEPDIDRNDKAKVGVWYRTNCRYFSEILKYCGNDLDLAEGCVYNCVTKLEKAGLTGGYAAVVRHLPEYYAEAKKQMEVRQ